MEPVLCIDFVSACAAFRILYIWLDGGEVIRSVDQLAWMSGVEGLGMVAGPPTSACMIIITNNVYNQGLTHFLTV